MKKFLYLIFFSLLLSGNVYAEWELVSMRDNGNTHFLDFKSKKIDGNNLYIWVLSNYKNNNYEFKSAKIYLQIECKTGKYRHASLVTYKEIMGKGSPSIEEPDQTWQASPPGSIGGDLVKAACK